MKILILRVNTSRSISPITLKKKHIFYYLVKYLINHNNEDFIQERECKPSKYKYFCSCLFESKYCRKVDLNAKDFNIFAHKHYDTEYLDEFNQYELLGYIFNEQISENLSNLFERSCFNYKMLELFKGSYYMEEDVLVKDNKVYLKNQFSNLPTFGFLNGLCLEDAIKVAMLDE